VHPGHAIALARKAGVLPLSALALALAFASPAGAAAPSANWAGYVAIHPGGGDKFSSVSGAWTQPTASCSGHAGTYSAVWVGLGGDGESAKALEQIGTDADCSHAGSASYSAWYELVPAGPVNLKLAVHPGDRMAASVTIRSHDVTLRLSDLSTGKRYWITRHTTSIDRSSAEWIVEAPSLCMSSGSCSTLPLTNFADVAFSSATATAHGHTGEITDSSWSASALELRQSSPIDDDGPRAVERATAATLLSATPSAVTSPTGAFSVEWSEQSIQAEAPAPTAALPGYGGGPP
jgi:hypothetical protein